MRVLIVGAGALGGLVGAFLTRAGEDVTLLETNAARAHLLNTDGLQIVQSGGGESITVPAGGERLYVVHQGVVDVLKLKNNFRSAKLRQTITSPTFDSPTTAALHKGRLYVVNSQFGKLFASPPVAPTLPFTISVLKPNGKH